MFYTFDGAAGLNLAFGTYFYIALLSWLLFSEVQYLTEIAGPCDPYFSYKCYICFKEFHSTC